MNDETIIEKNAGGEKPQPKKNENIKPVSGSTAPKRPTDSMKNENKKNKKVGVAVGAAAAAAAVGVAFGASKPFQNIAASLGGDGDNPDDASSASTTSASSGHLTGHDLEVATGVDDSMTFDEAFAAAREEVGAGGLFVWHGKTYGTYYENEWNNMSQADKDQYWANVHHTASHIGNNENMANNEPSTEPAVEPANPIDPADPTAGGNPNGEGIPSDPPGGWESPTGDPNGGGGNTANGEEPIAAPGNEPIPPTGEHDPVILDTGELILEPEELLEEIDTDGDGIADMAYVDADGNETLDLVKDTTGDGVYDTLERDVVGVEGELVPLGDVHDIDGIVVMDEFGCGGDGQACGGGHGDEYGGCYPDPADPDLDPLASNMTDPDIPIDNGMNMGEFV